MFTVTSAEIRWFIKGNIPDSIFDWFIGLNNNYINQPERTDHYLQLKSDDTLGIKLREGRVEIKQRTHHIGNISPGKNIIGNAEKWIKWSFELDQAKNILAEDLLNKKWLAVKKKRTLVNYGITEENIVSQKEPISYKNGCIKELTSINLNNEDWWSFGLESYGEENRQKDNLVLISHLILNDKSNIHFALSDSLSYPGLFKQLGNQ